MKRVFFFLVIIIFSSCSEKENLGSYKVDMDLKKMSFSHDVFNLKKGSEILFGDKETETKVKVKYNQNRLAVKTKGKNTVLSKKIFDLFLISDSIQFAEMVKVNLFQSVIKDNALIGVKAKFLSISSADKEFDVLFQEGFDKRIIESNKNREGIIVSISGSKIKVEESPYEIEGTDFVSTLESKILSVINGETPIYCLLDIKKTGAFLSLYNSFGFKKEDFVSINYYLNPVSNLLEPFLLYGKGKEDQLFKFICDHELVKTQFIVDGKKLTQITEFVKKHKLAKWSPSLVESKKSNQKGATSENCYNSENVSKYFKSENGQYSLLNSKTSINEPVILPKDGVLKLIPGDSIQIINGGFLLSFSPVELIGSKESPIYIGSPDSSGMGFHVINTHKASNLDYVYFNGLKNLEYNSWKLPSAVTFYESPVNINHSAFSNNNCEDAINIFRSTPYLFENSTISNTFSDAFDADFSDGKIVNCKIVNSGNDGVDISGSKIEIVNCQFINIEDKALSAGEKSQMEVSSVFIDGASLAITSKDLSKVNIENSEIVNSEVVYCAFQKKKEFGPSSIKASKVKFSKFKEANLIEEGSTLKIDGEKMHNYRDDVRKYLYGNEYGKKTVK